jgi:predicted Rossmann fold flavoprotein
MDIVVVGAGAAGCMAAIHAARAVRARGLPSRVLLLERTRDGGRKILISGGGRCNILPAVPDESRFVTDSSTATLRNVLRSWPHREQVRFFNEEMALDLTLEEASGKLFPRSNRARDVRDGLVRLAREAGAEVRFGCTLTGLAQQAEGWRVELAEGAPIDAAAVVLATGGLSVPTTGSDGTGLRLASALEHVMHATYPALTPLTTTDASHTALAGISGTVTLRASTPARRWETTGGFLFTHRGYSGPTVLDLSHLAVRSEGSDLPQVITAQWTALDSDAWRIRLSASGTTQLGTLLGHELPDRLAAMVLATAGVERSVTVAQLRREDRGRLVSALTRMPLRWSGSEGYKKAEVTGGGVSLSEVDPRTLESKRAPGLFLSGEMLDAFGPIGGYNFLWAWATGRAAGFGAAGHVRG